MGDVHDDRTTNKAVTSTNEIPFKFELPVPSSSYSRAIDARCNPIISGAVSQLSLYQKALMEALCPPPSSSTSSVLIASSTTTGSTRKYMGDDEYKLPPPLVMMIVSYCEDEMLVPLQPRIRKERIRMFDGTDLMPGCFLLQHHIHYHRTS
jgi:hypothetical protein